jgi:hypothetical protein
MILNKDLSDISLTPEIELGWNIGKIKNSETLPGHNHILLEHP